MIKHVVLLKFHEGVGEEKIAGLEKGLGALPEVIGEIQGYEFGRDVLRSERSFDFGLVSQFSDLDALKRYQAHPDHMEVLKIVKEICSDIVVVDFEF